MRRRKCRIERNGGLEEAYRLLAARTRILFQKERSLEVAFECHRGDRTRRGEPREVLLREAGLDLPGNRLRDVALKTEHVVAFAIEDVRPERGVRGGANQFDGDADPPFRPRHRALDDALDVERLRDLRYSPLGLLERHDRRARDDEEPRDR